MRKTEYNTSIVQTYCKPKGKQRELAGIIEVSEAAISRLRNSKHGYIDDKTYDKLDKFFHFNEIASDQIERSLLKAFRVLPEHVRTAVLACVQSGYPKCSTLGNQLDGKLHHTEKKSA